MPSASRRGGGGGVGWGDIALFGDFRKRYPIRYICMCPIPEYWRLLPHAQPSFLFEKNTETLKINIFSNLQIHLHFKSKNNCQKEIWNSIWFTIFLGLQNGQNWFCPWWRQKQFCFKCLFKFCF